MALTTFSKFASYTGQINSDNKNIGAGTSNIPTSGAYVVVGKNCVAEIKNDLLIESKQDEELIKEIEKSNYHSVLTPAF